MAVLRQMNWLGNWRVDVPHLRMIELGVAGDFDVLAGKILSGAKPLIVKGFNILMPTAVGNPATNLQVNVQDGVLLHFGASDNGTLFASPAGATTEQLTNLNSNVVGAFTPSSTNYVGIDLLRTADATTADNVQFLTVNGTVLGETPETVPLARTLGYRFVVSPNAFSTAENVCPIAKVVTDAANNVVSVTDARPLFWRLGSGGDSPSANHTFSWPSRTENAITSTTTADPFVGGDKALTNLKDWMDATTSRIWELGGGEHWYSATSTWNVKLIRAAGTFNSTNDNFEWTGTDLHWKNLKVAFENSTATTNTITDNQAGSFPLAIGEAAYVDLNRATDGASLTVSRAAMSTLGTPTIPGSRFVIAWRTSDGVYTRDQPFVLGTTFVVVAGVYPGNAAGIVKLLSAPFDATQPVVPVTGTDQFVVAKGLSRTAAGGGGSLGSGALTIGAGANDSSITLGKSGQTTTIPGTLQGSTTSGVVFLGITNGNGITTTAGTGPGAGLYAQGGSNNGNGVTGQGGGSSGAGLAGFGAPSASGFAGIGVVGTGGTISGSGVGVSGGYFTGTSGSSAPGVTGIGGSNNGAGVSGVGSGTGAGGTFSNGTAATSTVRQDALVVANGDIDLSGVTYPDANHAHVNRITPKNICKAWATTVTDGSISPVYDGYNIKNGIGVLGGLYTATDGTHEYVQIVFANNMADTNYSIAASFYYGPSLTGSGPIGGIIPVITNKTTSGFRIYGIDISGAGTYVAPRTTAGLAVEFQIQGNQ